MQLSRLADYATLILAHMATKPRQLFSAQALAVETNLPLPTASKVVKLLTKQGILNSHRGINGGYQLARAATCINIHDIITAIDGPICLTRCIENKPCECSSCTLKMSWNRLNNNIIQTLKSTSIADLAQPEQQTCPTKNTFI